MAVTEIYAKLKRRKTWVSIGEAKQAMCGAFKLWSSLEKKYLPTYQGKLLANGNYFSRLVAGGDALNEIWDLPHNPNLTEDEHYVLLSTFDNAKVLGKDIPKFIEYLKSVGERYDTNHTEQAEIIETYYKENSSKIEAIAWNQTTIGSGEEIFGEKFRRPLEEFFDCFE